MEKRRKRRSAEDVEKSIWEAATTLIQKDGFSCVYKYFNLIKIVKV